MEHEKYAPFIFTAIVLLFIGLAIHVMSRAESVYFTAVINEQRFKKSQEDGTPFEPVVWRSSGDMSIDVLWWKKAIGCEVENDQPK